MGKYYNLRRQWVRIGRFTRILPQIATTSFPISRFILSTLTLIFLRETKTKGKKYNRDITYRAYTVYNAAIKSQQRENIQSNLRPKLYYKQIRL